MFSYFDGNLKSTKNKKWNVNEFVNGNASRGKNYRSITGGNTLLTDLDKELDRSIRNIDASSKRSILEFETILRDLKNKRKEIKVRTAELKSDPESESAFQKIDVDLILATLRVVESKTKVVENKFKSIRDEKKLTNDLKKASGKTGPVETTKVVETNSPLSTIAPQANTSVFRVTPSAPLVGNTSKFELPKKAPDVGQTKSIPVSFNETPNKKEIVVTESNDGEVLATTEDVNSVRAKEVLERLNNKETLYKNMKSPLGVNYDTTVKSVVNSNKNIVKKLYININTGEFWMRYFEKTDSGLQSIDSEVYESIMHIGDLTFNFKAKTVKTAFSEDIVMYEVVETNDKMPTFYRQEWAQPEKTRYLIDTDKLERL